MPKLAIIFAALAVVASGKPARPPARSKAAVRGKPFVGALKELSADVVAATTSSALLSPFVTIIDKSVTMSVSGAAPSLEAAFRANIGAAARAPLAFLTSPAYVIIFGVYLLTYLAANCVDTVCGWLGKPAAAPKLIATTATNVCACVAKDAQFARIFGASAPRAVPFSSLALFTARDASTIYFSFVAPGLVANNLVAARLLAPAPALNLAQLACPIAVQAVTGPLHLLGLDLYNRAGAVSVASRLRASVKNYGPVVAARMMRILPAFGIGGVGNRVLRNGLRRQLVGARDT